MKVYGYGMWTTIHRSVAKACHENAKKHQIQMDVKKWMRAVERKESNESD